MLIHHPRVCALVSFMGGAANMGAIVCIFQSLFLSLCPSNSTCSLLNAKPIHIIALHTYTSPVV